METPVQKCARLVTALEDLVAQEAVCLQTRDFAAAISIQDRAAPLVEHLSLHGPNVADQALRRRVETLIARRNDTATWLATELRQTREQLLGLQASQRRVAKVAPAYGRGSDSRRQLCVRG